MSCYRAYRRADMITGTSQEGLQLTEDEAIALLGLCMTSPLKLDPESEKALRKLAEYCQVQLSKSSSVEYRSTIQKPFLDCELSKVGT